MRREVFADDHTIFLSYAYDDAPFVERLYNDLTAQGFDVWWDRQCMPSRARTFSQEIRDAIDARERLILVVGPDALSSDYVRVEWQYALTACKVVTPVLRLGDYDDLPNPLSNLHTVDVRPSRPYEHALTELVRVLQDPVPPLGELHNVPSLPAYFLPRQEHIQSLTDTLLEDVHRPTVITSAQQTSALQGMGGIGKSVLAAAFARACGTRRSFGDGIVWLGVGQDPNLLQLLGQIGLVFDDPKLAACVDESSTRTELARVLADKNCLLVLDDVWDVRHAEPIVNGLGTRCRLLITTRDGGLATSLGAQLHSLDVLSESAAMQLLAKWADQPVEHLPLEARSVAEECGYLPLALALAGAMARDGTLWADLLEALREADISFLEHQVRYYPYPDILKSIKVSLDMLAKTDPQAVKHYEELAVFPSGETVPEDTVVQFWVYTNGLNARSARKLITTLERKSLLRIEREQPRRIWLHDLQHDYLLAALRELTGLHQELLAAYRERCPGGWHTGPNDGYFFQRLPHHLVQAGRGEELADLLLHYDWLSAKLQATDVNQLAADYDLSLPHASAADDGPLHLVQGALRLSAHILVEDPGQLRSQLYGRLLNFDQPAITDLRRQVEGQADIWLRPLAPSLAAPGGPLLRTLAGHSGSVFTVAVPPDGKQAISASSDTTLKLWDLASGQELRTLAGHSKKVSAVAVTPDGKQAISASQDNTLKVWDLASGRELRTLTGHSGWVNAVAVTPDGKQAISASYDKTLKLWDLASGRGLDRLCSCAGRGDGLGRRYNGACALPAAGRRCAGATVGYRLGASR